MSKKKRRTFTKEFMDEAVQLYQSGSESLTTVARNLGIIESSLRRWVRQAEIDKGKGPEGALSTDEKAEVRRLKRDNRRLREENEFLKKATAYFAKAQENSK